MSSTASTAQINFLRDLVRTNAQLQGWDSDKVNKAMTEPKVLAWIEDATKEQASARIDSMLSKNKELKIALATKNAKNTPMVHEIEDGFYTARGDVYKVQTSPSSGNQYAKKLIGKAFVYAPGSLAKIVKKHGEKLTLDKAKEFGHMYGVCMICGRTLTDENSIKNGIGPICAGKL